MTTFLCILAFLFPLPWSLNGHLTTSQTNIEVTNSIDASRLSYTIGSGGKNVVSLSTQVHTLHHTSHTEQGIQQTSKNLQNDKQHEGQVIKEEVTIPEKETSLHTTSVQTHNHTKPSEEKESSIQVSRLTVTQPKSQNTQGELTTQEKASKGHFETQEAIQTSLSRSVKKQDFTSLSKQGGIHTNSNINDIIRNLTTTVAKSERQTIQKETETSIRTQDSTSHSKKRRIILRTTNSEDMTASQRMKRNIDSGEQNFTTVAQTESQTIPKEITQNEQGQKTEESHKPTTALSTTNNFNNSTNTTVLEDKTTLKKPSEILKDPQETPSTPFTPSTSNTVQTTVTEGSANNTQNHTSHPTTQTTDQPSPTTDTHTSTKITASETVNTSIETTEKVTSTQSLRTSTKTKSTKKLMTTKNQTKPPVNVKQAANPGPAVAAVIGTTFILMFIAIIFIVVKKRKMQKRQLENPEWAGPSPFLDGDVQPNLTNMDESQDVSRRGFSQQSISSYLTNRLSKHLTLGRNTSDEVLMEDIMQGSTFGRQNLEEVQPPNGNPTVSQEPDEEEEKKIQEDQEPVESSDTKTNVSLIGQEPAMESKEIKQTDDVTPSPTSKSKIKHPPPLVSIDLDSLSEETAPFQTSDDVAPPAPPMP